MIKRIVLISCFDLKMVTGIPIILIMLLVINMKDTEIHADKKLLAMRKIQGYYKRFEDITMIDTKGRVITSTSYNYKCAASDA